METPAFWIKANKKEKYNIFVLLLFAFKATITLYENKTKEYCYDRTI